MSEERKLYVLMAVAMSIAAAGIILAWAEGNLKTAVIFAAVSVGWSVIVLAAAQKVARRQEISKTRHVTARTPRPRLMVLEKTFSLLIIVISIASLIKALVSDLPLRLVFTMAWFIIVGGGHFYFVLLVRLGKDE
ncbi:hypothetical protein ACFLVN_06085 [Chloroflexota bacterium]